MNAKHQVSFLKPNSNLTNFTLNNSVQLETNMSLCCSHLKGSEVNSSTHNSARVFKGTRFNGTKLRFLNSNNKAADVISTYFSKNFACRPMCNWWKNILTNNLHKNSGKTKGKMSFFGLYKCLMHLLSF